MKRGIFVMNKKSNDLSDGLFNAYHGIKARRRRIRLYNFKISVIIYGIIALYFFIRFFHPNVWTAICVVAVVACAVIFLRWYLVKTGRIVEDDKPDEPDESDNSDET